MASKNSMRAVMERVSDGSGLHLSTPIVSQQDGPRMSGKLSNFGGKKATPFGKRGLKGKRARAKALVRKAKGADLSNLHASTRADLPDSAFVFPKTRKFPIHDRKHAKAALLLAGHSENPALVKAKVYARYPELRKGK